MVDIGYKYYRFGSKDSIDIDVLIEHEKASGEEKDKQLIDILKAQHPNIVDWNINIIAIEEGVVVKSIPSKGSPDAVNNSLFNTYYYHEQRFNFPLNQLVERDVKQAIEKCLTSIFTFYKGTKLNAFYKSIPKEVKNGKANFVTRMEWLQKIDFNNIPYVESVVKLNAYKSIAFHIGQTISLIDGVQIYTKQDLLIYHPELSSIIKREEQNNLNVLNNKLNSLIQKIVQFNSSKFP